MRYVEYGSQNPETIILLHGGGLSWWNYRDVAQLLSDRFRVILPILDGHADSDAPFTSIEDNAASGCRFIPMTDNVYKALKSIIANRKKPSKEWIIDGYSGFLLLDKNGNPKVAMHLEHHFQWALKKYRKLHPDKPLPKITPHVFRHTFCTNMANAGMDLKSLQYLMGHSDAGVTMNVYTHASYDHAEQSMQKILQFQLPEKALKSG